MTGVAIRTCYVGPRLILVMAGKTVQQALLFGYRRVIGHPVGIMVGWPFQVTPETVTVSPGEVSNLVSSRRSCKLQAFLVIVTFSTVVNILASGFAVRHGPQRSLMRRQALPVRPVVACIACSSHFAGLVALDTYEHVGTALYTGGNFLRQLRIPLVVV